jgi:imidazolonepropionase
MAVELNPHGPTVITGISELVQPHLDEGTGRSPVDVTRDAVLVIEAGKLVATGSRDDVEIPKSDNTVSIDLGGRAVVPGLVDSHTHVVFGGGRMDEMARRSRGETYEEIAEAGGGIVNSVRGIADNSVSDLVEESMGRIRTMISRGTTTWEIKTGYGLEPNLENKQLEAITEISGLLGPETVFATALAHVIPKKYRQARGDYIERFLSEVLEPAAKRGAITFCDVFVENTAYSPDEARLIAARAHGLGIRMKLHVDQLHEGGGAALAAELNALSADHLEKVSSTGRQSLAKAGVVATLLPGCGLFLGGDNWPNGRTLRDAGCEVAIATDANPGSSMVTDLALCATMGATQCGLSLEEALWGATRGGAKAMGLSDRGTLRAGERADFVVLGASDWRSLLYQPGSPPIDAVSSRGRWLYQDSKTQV